MHRQQVRLAAGFETGVATAWRYVQEAIALLSAAVDDLDTAIVQAILVLHHVEANRYAG